MRGGGIRGGSHKWETWAEFFEVATSRAQIEHHVFNIQLSPHSQIITESVTKSSHSPPPPSFSPSSFIFPRAKMKKLAILVHLDTLEPHSPSLSPSPRLSLSLAPSPLSPSCLTLPPLALHILRLSIFLTLSPSPSPSPSLLVAHQKLKRRSRAHNIPGGTKHLLSDSECRHRISVRSVTQPPSSTSLPFSHQSHPHFVRLRHKAANPAATQLTFTSSVPASESQCPHSQSQPQSPSPINVTFSQRLPGLPRKQIGSEVLVSIGFRPEVPSQYIRDQIECLGPMYVFVYLLHHASLIDVLV